MDDMILSYRIGAIGELCISTISRAAFEASEVDGLGEDDGYFIYERNLDGSIKAVLAKCASYKSAARLIELYQVALKLRATASLPRTAR